MRIPSMRLTTWTPPSLRLPFKSLANVDFLTDPTLQFPGVFPDSCVVHTSERLA